MLPHFTMWAGTQPLYPDPEVVREATLTSIQALDHPPLGYLLRNKLVLFHCCLPRQLRILSTSCTPSQGKLRGMG